MNFKDAIQIVKERMNKLLEQEGLEKDYTFEVTRLKNYYNGGFHNGGPKKVTINLDRFYVNIPNPIKSSKETGKVYYYTPIPKSSIPQALLDQTLVYQCHEVIHAKDYMDFYIDRNIPQGRYQDTERFYLEHAAACSSHFYDTHYKFLSFEAKAFADSVNMARDYLIKCEGVSKDEAEKRIVDALNYDMVPGSPYQILRPNPKYDRFNSSSKENVQKYSNDISIHNFDEAEMVASFIMASSNSYDFKDRHFSCDNVGKFYIKDLSEENLHIIERINNDIDRLGFSNNFYSTLSQKEKIYFSIALTLNYFLDIKNIDPRSEALPLYLNQLLAFKVLDNEKCNIKYFQERLERYNTLVYLRSSLTDLSKDIDKNELFDKYYSLSVEDRASLDPRIREFIGTEDRELIIHDFLDKTNENNVDRNREELKKDEDPNISSRGL